MPIDTRLNTPNEKLAQFKEFGLWKVKSAGGQSTTLTSDAAAGQKVLAVASETGFAAGEKLVIGKFNTMEIGEVASSAASTITLKSNLHFKHLSAETVKELDTVVLGEITDDGFTDAFTIAQNLHRVAGKSGIWDSTPGQHDQAVEARVVNATLDNWLLAFGLDDATGKDSGGAGSAADPWFLDTDPERISRALAAWAGAVEGRIPGVYVRGEYLNDGRLYESQYWSVRPGPGDAGFVLGGADPVTVMFRYNWFANRRVLRWTP